jgi:hypothetical protein
MRSFVTQLVIASGLIVLPLLAMGCDTEPTGSCVYRTTSSGSVIDGEGTSETYEMCDSDTTSSACAEVNGQFSEGGGCILFDLLHPPT